MYEVFIVDVVEEMLVLYWYFEVMRFGNFVVVCIYFGCLEWVVIVGYFDIVLVVENLLFYIE